MNERPIGAFDSGLGGLTVVKAIRALLPEEDLLYVGDTARVPYGNKSPETIVRYAREILAYLTAREVKAVVVACNTASAHALEQLRRESAVPLIGVIEPGVEAALAATRNGRVGIIGTLGTIQSDSYQRLLRAAHPTLQITAVATPLLVSLVEEDWLEHPAARLILLEYLAPLRAAGIDTLVLACTHYPLLRPLAQELLGPGVTLVDSAGHAARALLQRLDHLGLRRSPTARPGAITLSATDRPGPFGRLAERFLGEASTPLVQIELESVDIK